MDILDKIKSGAKSTKERAVMSAISPAMAMLADWTKDIKPENEISKFLYEKFGILFQTRQTDQLGGVTELLTKMIIAEANEDPGFVEHKLLSFYESFRVWYKDYQERICKTPPLL